MKNIYPPVKNLATKFIVTSLFMLLVAQVVVAQVIVPFAPRTSVYSPTKTIYNLKGDFTMVGNTNMTLAVYGDDTQNGNNPSIYVDIDGIDTTFNSSSAELTFSTENGALPECSNIIYAGLYWTGRAHNEGESPNTFQVTRDIQDMNNGQTVDTDYEVSHNEAVPSSNYTMTVSRQGSSSYTVRYTYTSSFTGEPLFDIEFRNSTSDPRFRYRYNSGTWITIPIGNVVITNLGNNLNSATFPPVSIYDEAGGILLTVSELVRDIRTNQTQATYQSTATASGHVSGTYYPIISFTKNFDKSVVYLKHENAPDYSRITAADGGFTTNILYPSNTYGNMFSGYAEVTDYVQQYGIGDYFVADIAILEGTGDGTGFYGGWGLIIVYENSLMKRRDVIVFDGHAYVVGSTIISHELPVSGFNTTQSGPVNMKLGLIAGEGDRGISGDYFQIRDTANANWVSLSHGGNSTTNFFNSSIYTGGNARNPNILNNTGMDASMFNIPNTNNYLITNEQDSTTFRYGSTQDTYIIFCIAMAVDAYIPEPEGLNVISSIQGLPPGDPPVAFPGQILTYTLEIRNVGEEPMEDVEIVIPMPYSADYQSCSATFESFPGFPSGNLPPIYDAGAGPTGSIIWQIGYLPLPDDPSDVLATLTYTLKATEDCQILSNPNCIVSVAVDGTISGTGQITGISLEDIPFIQGYEMTGNCIGEPIYDPVEVVIDGTQYVLENCQQTPLVQEFFFCNIEGNSIPVTEVSGNFPPGCRYYNEYPPDDNSIEYTISNPFPATPGQTTYYAIPPGYTDCYYEFIIEVTVISTSPTPTNPVYCQDDETDPLTATPSNPSYILYYYLVPTGGNVFLSYTPPTDVPGTFFYYVAEGLSADCQGPRAQITVVVHPKPPCSISGDAGPVCPSAEKTYTAPPGLSSYSWSISGNGGIDGPTNTATVDVIAGTQCDQTFTLELTVENGFDCSSTCSIEVEVDDDLAPVLSCPPDTIIAACTTQAVINSEFDEWLNKFNQDDNCDENPTVTMVIRNESGSIVTDAPNACGGYRDVTYSATDDCGNTSSPCIKRFTVTAAPDLVASCPTAVDLDACELSADILAEYNLWVAGFAVSGGCYPTSNIADIPALPIDYACNGADLTFTLIADNGVGYCVDHAECTSTFTVAPALEIELSCPNDTTVVCSVPPAATTWAEFLIAGGSASNYCGINETSFNWEEVQVGNTITRTYSVEDFCGNEAICEQIITIEDIVVNTWVYLEGSVINPGGIQTYTLPMRTTLNNLHVLPGQSYLNFFTGTIYSQPGQPYQSAPWNYPGTEGVTFDSYGIPVQGDAGYDPDVVDWVLVSLKNAPDEDPVCRKAAQLYKDGHIEFVDEQGFSCCNLDHISYYYIMIEHRNHLAVMSDTCYKPVNGMITFDFRYNDSYIYDPFLYGAVGQKELLPNYPGVYAMFAGNGDQIKTSFDTENDFNDVNFNDRTFWESQNGTTGRYRNADYNLNGDCNFNDRTTWEFNNTKFSSVPGY